MNKLVTLSAIFGMSFLLVGCGEEGKFEKAAIKELKSALKDPDSAKITDIEVKKCSFDTVRGKNFKDDRVYLFLAEVNAKNSYGGYTGKQVWMCNSIRGDLDLYCIEANKPLKEFCDNPNWR